MRSLHFQRVVVYPSLPVCGCGLLASRHEQAAGVNRSGNLADSCDVLSPPGPLSTLSVLLLSPKRTAFMGQPFFFLRRKMRKGGTAHDSTSFARTITPVLIGVKSPIA